MKWVVVRGAKNPNELDVNEGGAGGVLDVVMERFEVPSTLTVSLPIVLSFGSLFVSKLQRNTMSSRPLH